MKNLIFSSKFLFLNFFFENYIKFSIKMDFLKEKNTKKVIFSVLRTIYCQKSVDLYSKILIYKLDIFVNTFLNIFNFKIILKKWIFSEVEWVVSVWETNKLIQINLKPIRPSRFISRL